MCCHRVRGREVMSTAATAWAWALEDVYGLEGAAAMLDAVVGVAEELEGARALGALARPERDHRVHGRALARGMHPHVEQILDMGFSPPKDPQNPTFEEKKNSYLDAQATKVLCHVVSHVVISSITPFRSAHEFWTKLGDTYGGSKTIEDDRTPSTSPMCGKTQGNAMVSGDEHCIVDGEPSLDDSSSLSHCNDSSLDLNTYSTINALNASVDSPCISSSHVDMLALSCGHDKNASFSSSICVTNNVEKTEDTMGQDKILDGASTTSSSSSHGSYTCLMAKASKVSPSLEPYLSSDDEDDDMEGLNVASLNKLGESVFHALHKKKFACSNFVKILTFAIESIKLIDKMEGHEREDANEIATLSEALKEQQTTNESLEETFTLELSMLKAQVASLKKDLVKGHEGKQSPNDKSGLGFNSNNKNKSTTHKRKKGQGHVKDPAKIVCFKCKIEGHHVRSCPLKKNPHGENKQGKRPQDGACGLPQGQAQGLPRLEERSLPKKDQAKAPVVEKSTSTRTGPPPRFRPSSPPPAPHCQPAVGLLHLGPPHTRAQPPPRWPATTREGVDHAGSRGEHGLDPLPHARCSPRLLRARLPCSLPLLLSSAGPTLACLPRAALLSALSPLSHACMV
ncbi:hypothetical protein QYE76_064995 [Lolium multiflorum]|uniref:CCHC-type domain-containing protein n=1 Tax=Lolium multiflorum TaxID=4521 RepID=A0AAD8SA20_LOLMU|nr:hypothetical protein QYE76_064995 [Lolium multiflorum]